MKFISAVAASLIFLAACDPAPSPTVARSSAKSSAGRPAENLDQTLVQEKIGENTYRIAALGITVDAPAGWYVADSDLMGKLMDAGTEMSTATMDSGMKAAIASSRTRTATLFSFLEVPPGTPREYIPAIMGMAEDVSMLPGVARGQDYFFHAQRIMEQSAIPITVYDVFAERMIGGHSFDRMDADLGSPGFAVKQRYYAARRGDKMICFVQSYRTEEDLAKLDAVLDSIKLDW